MNSSRTVLEARLKTYRDVAALLFIISGMVFSSGLIFGAFGEVLATVAFMAIGLFLSCVFGFKQMLLNFHINRTK